MNAQMTRRLPSALIAMTGEGLHRSSSAGRSPRKYIGAKSWEALIQDLLYIKWQEDLLEKLGVPHTMHIK